MIKMGHNPERPSSRSQPEMEEKRNPTQEDFTNYLLDLRRVKGGLLGQRVPFENTLHSSQWSFSAFPQRVRPPLINRSRVLAPSSSQLFTPKIIFYDLWPKLSLVWGALGSRGRNSRMGLLPKPVQITCRANHTIQDRDNTNRPSGGHGSFETCDQ